MACDVPLHPQLRRQRPRLVGSAAAQVTLGEAGVGLLAAAVQINTA